MSLVGFLERRGSGKCDGKNSIAPSNKPIGEAEREMEGVAQKRVSGASKMKESK